MCRPGLLTWFSTTSIFSFVKWSSPCLYPPQELWWGLSMRLWLKPLEECLVHRKCSAEVVLSLPSLGWWRNITSSLVSSGCDSPAHSLITCITFELWPCCLTLLLGHLFHLKQHQDVASVLRLSTQANCLSISINVLPLNLKWTCRPVLFSPGVETIQNPTWGLEQWTLGNYILFLYYCFVLLT